MTVFAVVTKDLSERRTKGRASDLRCARPGIDQDLRREFQCVYVQVERREGDDAHRPGSAIRRFFVDARHPGCGSFRLCVTALRGNELHKAGIVVDPYLGTMKRYAKVVWSKTRDYDDGDGFTIYGITRMSAAKFDYSLPGALNAVAGEAEDLT